MSVIKNGGQVLKALARVSMVTALLAAMAAMATGANAQDGLSKTTVTLGQSVAMTGPAAVLALPFAQGARLYFERVNAAGGIHGRKIELITADDAGNPETTLANTKKLLDQRVFSLFGYYGSPQVTAVNPLLKDSDLLLFGPMAGADELRGSLYPNVYSVRPGYSEEAIVITRHAETLGMRKLAILHAKDPESLAALDSAERTMTGMGANLLLKAPLESTDKVLAVKAESVLLISAPKGAAIAIRDLRSNLDVTLSRVFGSGSSGTEGDEGPPAGS